MRRTLAGQLSIALAVFAFSNIELSSQSVGKSAGDPKGPSHECFNVGDSVSIRGRIVPGINGGTYFELLDSLCVHYPEPTAHLRPSDVVALGLRLPANIYLEVSGKLEDMFPIVGIGIRTTSFKSIDDEVKAKHAAEKLSCLEWQDANSTRLSTQTHGANVVRNPQNSQDDDYAHDCAIWSVDTRIPHKEITIRRPKP